MISIPTQSKLFKTGQVSTAVVLPKDWIDSLKATLGVDLSTDEILVNIFGEEFLVIEVIGLKIKNKEDQKLLNKLKERFSVQKVE